MLYDSIAILEKVEAHEPTPFRPIIGQRDCPPDVLDLMEKCWADNPEERPPFLAVRSTVRDIMKYGCDLAGDTTIAGPILMFVSVSWL